MTDRPSAEDTTIPIQDAINRGAADASVAAMVHLTALESTMAALLEFVARRDGLAAIDAVRERALRLTETVTARTENAILRENRDRIVARIETLAEVPAALARAN